MKSLAICTYAICGTIASFYGQYELARSILLMLWLFDTLTGIVRYFRLGRLSSKGIRYGTTAKVFMLGIPYLIYNIINIGGSVSFSDGMLTIVFTVLGIAELISIIQNIQVIKSGEDITEQDAISKVLNGILAFANIALEQTIGRLQKGIVK